MPKWTFEPGHTAAAFCVKHMMVSWVRGHFKNLNGTWNLIRRILLIQLWK